ncbi:hypothetical protein SY83_09970 [Paenibacillus swuensis]|uniref:Phytanoyl-CoA dioxygenase n=1 Tax=Paenibacillus swuensis TaxID=1178515 RepID=A0A172THQ5_9BACL|nr:phytanoyl-CoA dioxygenase family protein [Paenibacillus swuensis]ANE46550.1 hypothetical protein SY83_09970 [Paenibacillus swuensis]
MQLAPTTLTQNQVQDFHDKGYLVLRKAFNTEETAKWQAECDRLLTLTDLLDPNNIRTGFRKLDNGEQIIERIDPVIDVSPVFMDLVNDQRILGALHDIYGQRAHLFKDKLIYKLPGVSGYTMHQDAAWWQGFPYQSLISVMVAIDGANRENGGLELFPGYQDRLMSEPGVLRNMNDEEIAQIDLSTGEIVETEPGDIILFHSLTPHQSGVNTANRSRRQYYLTYVSSEHGRLYDAHYEHYKKYNIDLKEESVRSSLYFK